MMFPPPKIDLTSLNGHTPGPWIAVGRRVEHPTDSVPDICTTAPEAMDQNGRSDAECCANARLIAAAPLLLAEVATLRDRVRELTLYAAGLEVQRDELAARLEATEAQQPSMYVLRSTAGSVRPTVVTRKSLLSCVQADHVDAGTDHLDPLFATPGPKGGAA